MEKYPAYKDSGLEWLEEIPNDWQTQKGQFIFKVINERSKTGKELLLSVSEKKGVTPRSEANVTMFLAESYVGYKLCKPGDLVINSLWAWSNGLGISDYNGIISTAYSVYRPNHKKFDSRFLNYLLKTQLYVDQFRIHSKGIWTSRLQLHDWSFLRIPILFPKREEQTAIANFLDHKTAQIDRFIQLKEKTIALLEERKAAIINQAVTKGLNPDVPMKDSGIEWLGEIPEYWEVIQIRYLIRKMEQGWSPLCDDRLCEKETDIGVIKVGAVNDINFSIDEHKLLPKYLNPKLEYLLREGDFLVSRANTPDLIALAAIVPKISYNLLLCDKVYRLHINEKKVNKEFLLYAFRSFYSRKQIESKCTGASSSMQNISQKSLKEVLIIYPKDQNEQKKISEYIKSCQIKISKEINQIRKEISLIKEYRESLISSAVTGKIDIRKHPYAQQHVPASNL